MEYLDNFLYAIISDTVKNIICWKSLNELSQTLCELLELDEFHSVDSNNSYYATIKPGQIWLVFETIESGKDSHVFEGYSIYIKPNDNNSLKRLPYDPVQIERLVNVVTVQFSAGDPDVKAFIDSYFAPPHQPD